jgi:hypothetical protein
MAFLQAIADERRLTMSHITQYGKKVNDVDKFCQIAKEKGHEVNAVTEVRMFGSQRVEAVASVLLKDWRYPLAVDKQGAIFYDHFGSPSNSMRHLGELYQDYSLSRTLDIIPFDEVEGYHVEELKNGDKKLVLEYA